jgi:hypothetical protein
MSIAKYQKSQVIMVMQMEREKMKETLNTSSLINESWERLSRINSKWMELPETKFVVFGRSPWHWRSPTS